VIEWFISVSMVSYAIEKAKQNVQEFTKEMFVYLKISSTVIFRKILIEVKQQSMKCEVDVLWPLTNIIVS